MPSTSLSYYYEEVFCDSVWDKNNELYVSKLEDLS